MDQHIDKENNVLFYEDMYVQASEHFPGICLDLKNRKLSFSTEKFIAELEETLSHFRSRTTST